MKEIVRKLFCILSKDQKRKVAGLGVLILIGAALETVGVGMILPLASAILDVDKLAENEYVQIVCSILHLKDMRAFILLLLVAVIAVFFIKNIYLLILTYLQARFVNYSQFRTVSYMLSDYLNRPYEFYLNADIPTLFRTVDGDVPKVFQVLMSFIQLMTECVVAIFLCVFLLIIDPGMTIIIGVILLSMTFMIVKILKPRLNRMGMRSQSIQSQMGKWRLQSIYGIKDVKVLHKEAYFVENFTNYSEEGADVVSKYIVMNNMPRLLIETMAICGVLGYMAVSLAFGKAISDMAPQMMAFAVAAIRLMPSVNRINTHVTNIAFFQPSVDYIYENIDFTDYNIHGKYIQKNVDKVDAIPVKDAIRLDGITFHYPNVEKNVLTNAQMEVPLGKSVGIMGPSGSGKTTAVDILLGLLHPQAGQITCGGVDVMDNYGSWLSHIGYIPQAIFLTDDSIRQNIAFGIAPDQIDDKRVWEVIEEAQLTDYVKGLEDGLNTTVGDRGIRMSGGQRQRLGIARALYHNPEILVFDEATSALDNDTETAIMEAIDSFHGRKTLIIIAHRLRTIENCDIIYKVDQEKIVRTTFEEIN